MEKWMIFFFLFKYDPLILGGPVSHGPRPSNREFLTIRQIVFFIKGKNKRTKYALLRSRVGGTRTHSG